MHVSATPDTAPTVIWGFWVAWCCVWILVPQPSAPGQQLGRRCGRYEAPDDLRVYDVDTLQRHAAWATDLSDIKSTQEGSVGELT